MKKIAYITVILCLLLACGSRKEYKEILVKAETIMYDHPDSALHMLEQLRDTMQSAGKADRMYYELLLADAQNKSYVDFTTDSIMKEVVRYYDRHGSANERMRAHYLLGCTYRDMGEAPMALQCYQDAVDKADTNSLYCDSLLCKIHGQMAHLYYEQYLPDKSLSEMEKAEYYAWKVKDTLSALVNYEWRANVYDMKENPDSAIIIRKTGIYRFLKSGYIIQANKSIGALIMSLANAQRYDEMPTFIVQYERESGLFDSNGRIKKGFELYYYAKSQYYIHTCISSDSAEYYLRRLYSSARCLNDSLAACQGLMQLYESKNNSDSIVKYAHLYIMLSKKAFDYQTVQSLQRLDAAYKYARHERIAKEKEERLLRMKHRLVLLISSFIIVALLTILYIKRKRYNDYLKIAEIKNAYQTVCGKLEQKQGELSSLLSLFDNFTPVDSATSDDTYNKLRKLIEVKVKEISLLRKQMEVQERNNPILLDDRLMSSPVYQRFKGVANGTERIKLEHSDWDALRQLMDGTIPAFRPFLRREDYALSFFEQDFCILVRMHFTNTEICHICNLTSSRVATIRSRLLKKVFKVKGSPKDFDYRINRIT